MRIPVVLRAGAEVQVIHADLLELRSGPAQFLVHIAGGDERAIGVVHLFPVQFNGV